MVDQWEDALNRPWERSGRFLASRMPDGTTELDQAAADLDLWCLRHVEENSGARHNARHDGIEDRMVSANLPEHTPVTEINSLTHTAAYLAQRGTDATEAERERKKAMLTKHSQGVGPDTSRRSCGEPAGCGSRSAPGRPTR